YNINKISDDKIVLEINKNHYHYSEDAPQKIEYIVSKNTSSLNLLDRGEIDLITPDDYSTEPQALVKHYNKQKHNIHQTFNIKSNLLVFTDKGIEKLSKERRLKIGKIIRAAFKDKLKDKSTTETAYQFFPDLGESSLKGTDLFKVKEQFNIDTSD